MSILSRFLCNHYWIDCDSTDLSVEMFESILKVSNEEKAFNFPKKLHVCIHCGKTKFFKYPPIQRLR